MTSVVRSRNPALYGGWPHDAEYPQRRSGRGTAAAIAGRRGRFPSNGHEKFLRLRLPSCSPSWCLACRQPSAMSSDRARAMLAAAESIWPFDAARISPSARGRQCSSVSGTLAMRTTSWKSSAMEIPLAPLGSRACRHRRDSTNRPGGSIVPVAGCNRRCPCANRVSPSA